MSLLIREFSGNGNNFENVTIDNSLNLTEDVSLEVPTVQSDSLMVDIEAIHSYPYATRNFTRYMPNCLRKSVESWLSPYRRPMITFHNEKDGDIVGRIVAAEYVTKKTKSGTPALVFTVNIADKDAIDKVKHSIYSTTSIGVIANTVKCSICGQDITQDGPCDHERGTTYDEGVCYWDIYDMEGKECSYVIVPSDIYSGNIKIYKPTGKETKEGVIELPASKLNITEGLEDKNKNLEGKNKTNMSEEEIKKLQTDLKEAQDKVAALETEKTGLAGQITTTEGEKKAAEDKLALVEAALTDEKTKNVGLATELNEAKTTAGTEKALRESLETQLQVEEKKKKQNLIETVISLRKSIGGKSDISTEMLQERSNESLNDSIKDLEEELKLRHFPDNHLPQYVTDPTLHEENDVEKKKPTLDVKESLSEIIGGCFKKH